MNTLTQKLNIAKLYFQADKKRLAAAVLLFALVIGSSWASLTPNTLADDYGYYYGGDSGYSNYGYSDYSYSSPSYDYSYGSTPSYSYDYSSYSTPAYSYNYNSAPSYDYYTPSTSYDYYYGSAPSYDYSYSAPDYYSYASAPAYDYSYSPDYSYPYDYSYPSYSSFYDSGYNYGYSYPNSSYSNSYSYPSYSGNSDYGYGNSTDYSYNYSYNDNYNYSDYSTANYSNYSDSYQPYTYQTSYYTTPTYNYSTPSYSYDSYAPPSASAYVLSPQFNIHTPYTHTQMENRDYYLLDIKNETKNTGYDDPINADAGDTLVFSVYYHNAINESVARNTKIRVNIPNNIGTQIVSTAYLSADNATQITETGTVNVSSPQRLEFVSGSAKWYPDQRNPNTSAAVALPSGQTGDEIVNNGINLGDIKGCWEYSGFVNFRVRVSSIAYNANLAIEKTVKNISSWQYNYAETVNAKPNQRISFQIIVRSTGNIEARNVIVRDALPGRMSYVSNSTRVNGSLASDGITSSGINIGNIPAGEIKTITLEADVANEYQFSKGDTTLINTAYAKADNASEKNDPANVVVRYEGCDPNIHIPGWR